MKFAEEFSDPAAARGFAKSSAEPAGDVVGGPHRETAAPAGRQSVATGG
jgi:hypothetical protein